MKKLLPLVACCSLFCAFSSVYAAPVVPCEQPHTFYMTNESAASDLHIVGVGSVNGVVEGEIKNPTTFELSTQKCEPAIQDTAYVLAQGAGDRDYCVIGMHFNSAWNHPKIFVNVCRGQLFFTGETLSDEYTHTLHFNNQA